MYISKTENNLYHTPHPNPIIILPLLAGFELVKTKINFRLSATSNTTWGG